MSVVQTRWAPGLALADVFPELRDSMSPDFRGVTIAQLLSHHDGISPFDDTDADAVEALIRRFATNAAK